MDVMSPCLTMNRRPIPILVYHQISEAPPRGSAFRSLYVAPAAFARQMSLLKFLGFRGLSMSDIQPYLLGQKVGRVVGITFDDGYQNNLTHALPVLEKNRFSSTCYAVSGQLGKRNIWDENLGIAQTQLMDQSEISAWVAAGQEIGSHTRHHIDLTEADDQSSKNEIVSGRYDLEAVLRQPVAHFCYPYGNFTAQHVDLLRTSGFSSATTTQRSRCRSGTDFLQLPRVPVLRSTTLPLFLLKVATGYEDRRKK